MVRIRQLLQMCIINLCPGLPARRAGWGASSRRASLGAGWGAWCAITYFRLGTYFRTRVTGGRMVLPSHENPPKGAHRWRGARARPITDANVPERAVTLPLPPLAQPRSCLRPARPPCFRPCPLWTLRRRRKMGNYKT